MDLCTSQSLLWITFKLWGNRRSSQLSLLHNTGVAKDQEFSSPTCDENFWNVMLQIHRGQKWFLVSLPAFTKPWPMDLVKPCWSIQAMSTWHHIWRGGVSLSFFYEMVLDTLGSKLVWFRSTIYIHGFKIKFLVCLRNSAPYSDSLSCTEVSEKVKQLWKHRVAAVLCLL